MGKFIAGMSLGCFGAALIALEHRYVLWIGIGTAASISGFFREGDEATLENIEVFSEAVSFRLGPPMVAIFVLVLVVALKAKSTLRAWAWGFVLTGVLCIVVGLTARLAAFSLGGGRGSLGYALAAEFWLDNLPLAWGYLPLAAGVLLSVFGTVLIVRSGGRFTWTYLTIVAIPPLYFILRKRWGGFTINAILYGLACLLLTHIAYLVLFLDVELLVAEAEVGLLGVVLMAPVLWLFAVGHAGYYFRHELMASHIAH